MLSQRENQNNMYLFQINVCTMQSSDKIWIAKNTSAYISGLKHHNFFLYRAKPLWMRSYIFSCLNLKWYMFVIYIHNWSCAHAMCIYIYIYKNCDIYIHVLKSAEKQASRYVYNKYILYTFSYSCSYNLPCSLKEWPQLAIGLLSTCI